MKRKDKKMSHDIFKILDDLILEGTNITRESDGQMVLYTDDPLIELNRIHLRYIEWRIDIRNKLNHPGLIKKEDILYFFEGDGIPTIKSGLEYGNPRSDKFQGLLKKMQDESRKKIDYLRKIKSELLNKNNNKNEKNEFKIQKPSYIEEEECLYLQLDEEKIKIGKITTRHARFLKCMLDEFGTARTIDSVFEKIILPKDAYNSDLRDPNTAKNQRITIIKNQIKELQKENKLKKKIKFIFNKTKTTIQAQYISS
jgi:hypothetical protein